MARPCRLLERNCWIVGLCGYRLTQTTCLDPRSDCREHALHESIPFHIWRLLSSITSSKAVRSRSTAPKMRGQWDHEPTHITFLLGALLCRSHCSKGVSDHCVLERRIAPRPWEGNTVTIRNCARSLLQDYTYYSKHSFFLSRR